ncbi:MAG TPA: TetR/AcrR family transcriptional regulator [Labilithrix sp.]|jgi:AcrR family transcriptional regulator
MSAKTRKEEYAEATRAALVDVARALFAERGYAAVSIDEIVQGARVTKGALYHHFDDKQALFREVLETIERHVSARMRERAATAHGPWEELRAACHAYLDACLERDVQRIVVLDAPSVLGWHTWCEIDRRHGLGVLRERFEAALEHGLIDRQPLEPVALLVLGTLSTGGRVIAEAKDASAARKQVGATIERLLSGLLKAKSRR